MNSNTDWKTKYQGVMQELDAKESEWKSLEDILRKAVGRLCIAGRGHDKKLDDQLKLIQSLSRKRKNQNLPEALEKLDTIIGSLDETREVPAEEPATDTVSILGDLLKKLKLNPEQQSDLESIGSDLLTSITEGLGTEKVNRNLTRLSAIINKNIDGDMTDDQGAEIIFRLVSLLAIDEDGRKQIDQQFPGEDSLADHELKKLARIINSQFNSARQQDSSIAAAISSLLEQLSKIQGAPFSTGKILSRITAGVADDEWQGVLDEVATSISETLGKLAQEKKDLANLIVKVTEQIGQLTEFVTESHEDHLSGQQETLTLHQLMQEGVAKIEVNVNSAQDIVQLKTDVAANIHLIREGVEGIVDRIKSRHEAVEARNERLTRKISSLEKEASQLQKKLKESSKKLLHDTLTGMGSRFAYEEQLVQELARCKRYGSSFSYVILDIDHFKKINDKYGHIAGDKALRIIAQLMMKQIRKSDHLYRIGGEEFALLVTNTELLNAETMVDKIRKVVADSGFHYKQEQIVLTLSAGITESRGSDDAQTIFERADTALYRAKNSGRNCQFVA